MDRHEPMLPPAPAPEDTSPELPRLVDFDEDSELWHAIEETAAETWRPTGYE